MVLHHSSVLQSMKTFGVRALAVSVLLVAQGCVFVFKRGGTPDLIDGRYDRPEARAGTVPLPDRWGPKAVEGKQPPSRLLARDGTSCSVSKKKFESTVLGASVWCAWIGTAR